MELVVAALPAFLASLVEAVEALTIILAVGVTRQWRSALYGAFAGLVVLIAVVAVFGTAIVLFVPIDGLRIVIGGLLLIYGLQWTCKAILRASGAKALHDEELIYQREVKRLREEAPVPATGIDGVSFAVSFKGVLLEGLEVAFIVITFGSSAGALGASAVGAVVACLAVAAVGVIVHRPLSRVPENGLKYVVGIMLISFGTFWAGEGIGIEWPA
jgi:Ca2+/H+ antiporter, TMEM165/GDT1 family